MGLFLRRALAVCLLFAVLSLTAPVSKVHGQASVEITDFQYPAHVAQGSEATISFTVSWTGAPEGGHVSIVLAEKGYVRGRVEQPSSCIAPEGYATCEILSPTYSGREYVKFVLDPQPLGKQKFGLVALLSDANGNTLADSGAGNNFFAIYWTSASTTATTTAARTAAETTPVIVQETVSTTQWLTDNWMAIVFGAIVVAALIGLLLAVRMRARASPPAPTQRSTTTAETVVAESSTEVAKPRVRAADPTKFCRHCGARISRDSTFCQECGKEVGGQVLVSDENRTARG